MPQPLGADKLLAGRRGPGGRATGLGVPLLTANKTPVVAGKGTVGRGYRREVSSVTISAADSVCLASATP